jgi:cell division protein FtsW (lipid II flippase)
MRPARLGLIGAVLLVALHAFLVATARVNFSEADSLGNHCVVVGSSLGWLIQTAVGSAGGSGGLPTNRSGWAA